MIIDIQALPVAVQRKLGIESRTMRIASEGGFEAGSEAERQLGGGL